MVTVEVRPGIDPLRLPSAPLLHRTMASAPVLNQLLKTYNFYGKPTSASSTAFRKHKMPPRAKKTQQSADYDSDIDGIFQAQQRIRELKKEKNDEIQKVVGETEAQLEKLQKRIHTTIDKKHKQSAKNHAADVAKLAESVERRAEIERDIISLTKAMSSKMHELETMMLEAYDHRVKSAQECIGHD
ncbi:uncharacterized protein F5Z01DRAFT_312724 [Emericellopsis atlantica]|uniref:Uncharacterized protein n=1 Tax=Emericellopsis atlantica TaxID=2614577 RepID=A0A9P7ZTV0_9HYPO|nr:uncharacterized protein F5Z01DRAFT_312724 [Emericellopsis atlantica]KAG9257996.1 hypothetical protein F5Z01DRAFT_312724 [Emericellopsis atlantica]